MGFDNHLSDGEPHSRSRRRIPLIAASVELVEDQVLLKGVNAWSLISDAYGHFVFAAFGGYTNRSSWLRILCCILQQMAQHLSDSFRIHAYLRQRVGHDDLQVVVLEGSARIG